MAFAATLKSQGVMGNMRYEMWSFTELATDTGGTLTTGLRNVSDEGAMLVSVNLNFACSISISGLTVTVGNAAGPTAGRVLLFGK